MSYITVNGIETYYERLGEGHPIVFIHGGGWDSRHWEPQFTALADEYELIRYDVRGHGQTGGSDEARVTHDTLAQDLKELIEALELDNPTLVGLSMGGRIAHICAATYPDIAGSLVTYEAPLKNGDDERRSLTLKLHSSLVTGVLRLLGPRRAVIIQHWLRTRLGDMEVEDEDKVIDGVELTKKEYVLDAAGQMTTREQLKILRTLEHRVDTPAEITIPALILTGDGPSSFNIDAADRLAEQIPNARRETIPDAGHAGNFNNPDAFNRGLREFINEVHSQPTRSTTEPL